MRKADRFDLSQHDPATIDLPVSGERILRDTVAPSLALRLRAGGSRTWVVLTTSNGRTVRRSLGDAVAIPLRTARKLACADPSQAAQSDATDDAEGSQFGLQATVAQVLPRYLAFGAKGRWKPSTGRQMESIGRTAILPQLGNRMVRDLTPQDVACWHRDISARTTSARMALSTLSGMMLFAEDHGLRPTGSNPCRGLRKKAKGHRGRHFPPGGLRKLWAALDRLQAKMPDYCDAVRLLVLTGARRSEILGLTWDTIVGPRAVLADSKSGPRTIWLNTPAREILDARRERVTSPYVFPSPRLDGPLGTMDAPWRAILEEAGLSGLRVHDLRHHFASVAVSNGIDIRLVGQLLGHHEIDSTLGYAHLATGALVKSANRVSGLIDRSMAGKKPAERRRPKRASGSAIAVPRSDRSGTTEAAHG